MNTIHDWLKQVYKDNGLWPTLITLLVIIAILTGLAYLDISYQDWLP